MFYSTRTRDAHHLCEQCAVRWSNLKSQVTQLVKDAQGTLILVVDDDAAVAEATLVSSVTAVDYGSPSSPVIAHYQVFFDELLLGTIQNETSADCNSDSVCPGHVVNVK